MPSAYSRVQPSPSSGSIALTFTDSRSRACIAAITCSTGRFVNFAFIVSSVLKFVNTRHTGGSERPASIHYRDLVYIQHWSSAINLKRRMTPSLGGDSPKECPWKPERILGRRLGRISGHAPPQCHGLWRRYWARHHIPCVYACPVRFSFR